jgi:PhnB protein
MVIKRFAFVKRALRFLRRPTLSQIDGSSKAVESHPMTTSTILVQPYLFFGGRCDEALEFYRVALGAEVLMLSRFKDSPEPDMVQPGMEEKIMHASFRIGKTMLMASDGRCEGGAKFEGFSLSITVPNETEADRVFTALSEGGQVTMPLERTFWSPKFGMLTDRFGVGWMVSVAQDQAPRN